MDEYDEAKRQASAAMACLSADYHQAVEAFHRLQEAHRRGDWSPGPADDFRALAQRVHTHVAAAQVALAGPGSG